MKFEYHPQRILWLRLLYLLVLSVFCRAIFYFVNSDFFAAASSIEIVSAFVQGVRFDIAAIVFLCAPYALLYLVPLSGRCVEIKQHCLRGLYILSAGFILAANLMDTAYFRYTLKRATADVFVLMSTGGDAKRLAPQFLRDFWYVPLLFALLIFLTDRFYAITRKVCNSEGKKSVVQVSCYSLGALLLVPCFVLGARGGLQLKPLDISSAAKFSNAQLMPLVLNTPYSLLRTLNKQTLKYVEYMPQEDARKLFDPYRRYDGSEQKKLNVVVIILESFSREYVFGNENTESYAPFLKELAEKSLNCTSAYANGKNSVDSIPAVLASLPSLMPASFLFSPYSTNRINSLASLLKPRGYSSAFFHGGENGTMNFNIFARIAGFDSYYGRKEYNNDKDYDGAWGILDEEYFQYVAHTLENMPQPFMVSLFSLSSHHPYPVPAKHKGKFKTGTLPIMESIGYVDYSLKRFFETASKMPWYENTLFVITADHTAESQDVESLGKVGMYEIPLMFYRPNGELKGEYVQTAQQLDVMPTVLDLLGYSGKAVSFGSSLFASRPKRFAISYWSGVYQLISDKLSLQSNGVDTLGLYDFEKDPLLETNQSLVQVDTVKNLSQLLQAVVQQYNSMMITNRLVSEDDIAFPKQ